MIILNNVTTGYKKKEILKDFSYKFDNKIYGILGQSGCGKTTLLRTIAGLIRPLQGNIDLYGNVYMMHQNYTSFDWLSCLDNVLITKKIKSFVTKEDIQHAKNMLKKVHLEKCMDQYPKQLSGGMRQRLALARTLFMNPVNILMDEPLSALDIDTRYEMQDLIMKMHKETNNTIIMVTHSPEEAQKMCDEIIKL